MARELGWPARSSYAFYEDPKKYKKSYLAPDRAAEIAEVLGRYGVNKQEVFALVGAAAPANIAATPAARPDRPSTILLAVALPSEEQLTEMFDAMLMAIPEGLPRSERAQWLAQNLPVALERVATQSATTASAKQRQAAAPVSASPLPDEPGRA